MILLTIFPFKYKVLFILAATGILILLICFFKKYMNHRRKKKEIAMAAADRMRDENLNHIILNSYADRKDGREVYMPYDVDYGGSDKSGSRKGNQMDVSARKQGQLMVQLVEQTKLSTRKFLLNPERGICIGSNAHDNDISVLSEGIAPRQCEIFAVGGKIYIRDMGEGSRTILKRKKERVIVDGNGIRLLSGDGILFGSVTYDITIIKSQN